jgi:ZIP family zinc transporter
MMWSGVAIVTAISAAAGYALLGGASPQTVAFVLAFAAGSILTMLSTSMIPEAYEGARRPVGLATSLGFAVAIGINWIAG